VLSEAAVSVRGRLPNSPQLVLNYAPPPLRVEIEHLTEDRGGRALVKSHGKDRGKLVFPETASGQVWLHGHISWADKGPGRDDSFLLRVFVNGFQQYPERIERKSNELETPFRIQLLLNRAKSNHINLVASRQDAGGDAECTVDCRNPVTRQRLYVLALSARSPSDQLRERILNAINSRRTEKRDQASAFEHVKVTALTGDRASPNVLGTQLYFLEEEMRQNHLAALDERKPMNDVLMIYYEGGETIDEDGHFFETQVGFGKADPHGMSCDKLVDYLSKVPGAHVLLLDVERAAQAAEDIARDKIESWKRSYPDVLSHVVVMRCAHRGAARLPGQVRLLPVLQQTIPRAGRLIKLVALVENVLSSANDPGLLIFRSYVPIDLADLMIGPPD
jgi:hypothetical protein